MSWSVFNAMMTCSNCQSHIVAYLHGELTPSVRRQVAYHLDECPFCYAVYAQQREIAQELAHFVPLIGQDHAPRLGRMWSAIQSDMTKPRPGPYQARYGFAAFFLVLALIVPWTLGSRNAVWSAPPTQPSPLVQTVEQTPGVTEPGPLGTAVALSVTVGESLLTPDSQPHVVPGLDVTPAPKQGA